MGLGLCSGCLDIGSLRKHECNGPEYQFACACPFVENHKTKATPPKGYHKRIIPKGVLGKASKIREELEELEDAVEQGNRILVACELSDLYGALEAVVTEQGLKMEDLRVMAEATARAFKDGSRT